VQKHDEEARPAPAKPRGKKAAATAAPPEKNLVAMHNLSADNLKHAHALGGLAAPSLAFAHKNHPLTGFGEISLIAHHQLVDPKHTPVYDADVYSPRHPKASYKPVPKAITGFKSWIRPYVERIGENPHTRLYTIDDNLMRRGHKEAILGDPSIRDAASLAFLEEKGVKLAEPPRKPKAVARDWMREPAMVDFFAKHGTKQFSHGDEYHQNMTVAAKAAMASHAKKIGDALGKTPEDKADEAADILSYHQARDLGQDENGNERLHLGAADHLRRDASGMHDTEVDKYAMHDLIREAIQPHQKEFEDWAAAKAKPMEGEAYLTRENGRKAPYNLDSIMSEMTRKVRGAEGFNYGLGTARSFGARQFKTIDQVQQAHHKVVSPQEFKVIKEANDNKFGQLVDKISGYHPAFGESKVSFGSMDALAEVIGNSYKRGRSVAGELAASGFRNVPPHVVHEVEQFAHNLRNMPTEYFEAKPQRVVRLNEFKAAAVPHNVDQDTLNILAAHGINHIERYDSSGNDADVKRAEAIRRAAEHDNLLLSEKDLFGEPMHKAQQEDQQPAQDVAMVLVTDGQGRMLLGKRRDNGRWTMPGGHLEPGEIPETGARRELWEEAALQPEHLTFLRTISLPDGSGLLHAYTCLGADTNPHSRNDPDQEVDKWEWIDARGGLPANVYDKLHGPPGDQNLRKAVSVQGYWKGEPCLYESAAECPDIDCEHRLAKAAPPDLGYTSLDENGKHFETGHPVTMNFLRNTAKSPNMGETFQQHIEPAGRFMLHDTHGSEPAEGWQTGQVHFKNPLVVHFNTSGDLAYDGSSWKNRLHGAFKAKGAELSRKLAAKGHDAIVTVHDGATKEIVDLSSFRGVAKSELAKAIKDIGPGAKIEFPPDFSDVYNDSFGDDRGQMFNYSHVLAPEMRNAGYGVQVAVGPERTGYAWNPQGQRLRPIIGHVTHNGEHVGHVEAEIYSPTAGETHVGSYESEVAPAHRGKGLGQAAYEAMFAHAIHAHGATHASGTTHSTSAKRMHDRIASKHGIESRTVTPSEDRPERIGDNDSAFSAYSYPLGKSEAHDLLAHPDPRERRMALKLDGATPADVATAILDPDPSVWQAAFHHEDSGHALEVLASHSRDAAGAPLFDRHDALLADPRCTNHHRKLMEQAVRADADLPLLAQAQRLLAVVPRQLPLAKSAWAHENLAQGSRRNPESFHVDHTKETPRPEFGHLVDAYNKHVKNGSAQGDSGDDAGLHDEGVQPKAVYDIPGDSHHGAKRMMAKVYHDLEWPVGGWAENTSQHLYHAAGIGHLHQQVFADEHGSGEHKTPVNVIAMEDADPVRLFDLKQLHKLNPNAAHHARRIAIMDFISGNHDRHTDNMMVKPDGQLLAIDHGTCFDPEHYVTEKHSYLAWSRHNAGAVGLITGLNRDPNGHRELLENTIKTWWPKVSKNVRAAFNERLDSVINPESRAKMQEGFDRRASWLDRLARHGFPQGWMDMSAPPAGDSMVKTVKLFVPETEFEPAHAEKPGYAGEYVAQHPEWHARLFIDDKQTPAHEFQYHPQVPVAKIKGHESYPHYLADERREAWKGADTRLDKETWLKRQDPYAHLGSWLKQPQRQPVVLYENAKGQLEPADGSHRIGYAVEKGVTHIPAIIAHRKK
jgi:8-oxo-dGTP pyrophosphatase MutT (NUDIX family)/GNAT superfamily N-acetyltransferase